MNTDFTTVPPGELMMNMILEKDMNLNTIADSLNLDLYNVRLLLKGELGIDFNLAEKIYPIFGGSISYWLNKEQEYRKGVVNSQQN